MALRPDPDSPEFWLESWERKRAESPFMNSQENLPERWRTFYDGMTPPEAAVWRAMGDYGEAVCDLLFRERLISAGGYALEMGCGTGTLSLPLARKGVRVLAVDRSPGMLRTLATEAAERPNVPWPQPCIGDFDTFAARPVFDLAAAACFPPALSPEGLKRLEGWSRGHAAVVVGVGTEALPFRRDLYEMFQGAPLPSGRFHRIHLTGWLMASGRTPNLRHINFPLAIDHPASVIIRFYTRYFAIFGKTSPDIQCRIAGYFDKLATDGRIQQQGLGTVAVIWWRVPKAGGRP